MTPDDLAKIRKAGRDIDAAEQLPPQVICVDLEDGKGWQTLAAETITKEHVIRIEQLSKRSK